MECSISMKGTGIRLAREGMEVHGIDYEGHGKSSGLQGYISNFDDVVDDCSDFFTSITEKEENRNKLRYLLGEAMGGAVALLVHKRQPTYWDGAILVSPMLKVTDEMKPNAFVVGVLNKLSKIMPTLKIVPTKDIIDVGIKDPKKREEVRTNSCCYKGKPRLKTGCELLKVSMEMEKSLNEVSLPFLIVHGEEDHVTDPSVSKLLYESAPSSDKTLKLYPNMWHYLTSGESPENIELVFSDIISWLNKQIERRNSQVQIELGHENGSQMTASQSQGQGMPPQSPTAHWLVTN
ncbi:caffeoylshikimate esterase-like isoform X2 [Nymphaea colorata]|nr:caffeoylshikimate esterase-like isoform X2 [Nymphaea colorata]